MFPLYDEEFNPSLIESSAPDDLRGGHVTRFMLFNQRGQNLKVWFGMMSSCYPEAGM